jgi:hypothetical protein
MLYLVEANCHCKISRMTNSNAQEWICVRIHQKKMRLHIRLLNSISIAISVLSDNLLERPVGRACVGMLRCCESLCEENKLQTTCRYIHILIGFTHMMFTSQCLACTSCAILVKNVKPAAVTTSHG